jgi:hypothetical protein
MERFREMLTRRKKKPVRTRQVAAPEAISKG